MLPNPYTPGQVPRVLAGREPERSLIRGHLARVATYGELGGPLLVFHAPRGLGKTSLLRDAQRDAGERGFLTVWVSCRRRQPFLPELVDRVAHALEKADGVPTRQRARWGARVEKISLAVGPPGVKVAAEVARSAPPQPEPAPVAAVEDLLHEAAGLARGRFGAGLVVFVDELHAPLRTDTATFLNALQNLDGARTENPLAVFGAGLPSTPEELTRAATFGERSSFVELALLDDDASTEALVAPAQMLGVGWQPSAIAAVEEQARGYPYFLQLMAHAAWNAADPGPGDEIAREDVVTGLPAATDQLQAMYRARWRAATALEQQLMVAMTEVCDRSGAAARSAVADRMGRDTRAISMPRDRLLDKGIIEAAGRGRLRFTLPGFADYVRGQDTGETEER